MAGAEERDRLRAQGVVKAGLAQEDYRQAGAGNVTIAPRAKAYIKTYRTAGRIRSITLDPE